MLAETQIIRQPTVPALDAANHYLRVSSLPTAGAPIDDVLFAAPALSPSASSPTSAGDGVLLFPDALVSDSRLDSVGQFYRFDFLLVSRLC